MCALHANRLCALHAKIFRGLLRPLRLCALHADERPDAGQPESLQRDLRFGIGGHQHEPGKRTGVADGPAQQRDDRPDLRDTRQHQRVRAGKRCQQRCRVGHRPGTRDCGLHSVRAERAQPGGQQTGTRSRPWNKDPDPLQGTVGVGARGWRVGGRPPHVTVTIAVTVTMAVTIPAVGAQEDPRYRVAAGRDVADHHDSR